MKPREFRARCHLCSDTSLWAPVEVDACTWLQQHHQQHHVPSSGK